MKPVTRRKPTQVNPENERLRNELMDAYLAFVRDAGYEGYPVEKVEGWPKGEDNWASFVVSNTGGHVGNMRDPNFRNAYDLVNKVSVKHADAKMGNWKEQQRTGNPNAGFIDPSMYYSSNEKAFQDLPDGFSNDNYAVIPRPRFRLNEMNPFELLGFDHEIPDREIQRMEPPQQMDSFKTEPIMRADGSVRGGQYQIGERVWDPEKKKWQNRMWDREDRKASRELQGELKEKWRRGLRNIETPPGGFKYGGKIKVKKKNC